MRGSWPASQIDHRDGNPSNNAWANIRQATQAQNQRNRGMHKSNRVGLKGVKERTRDGRPTGKFRACIRVDNKQRWLGTFDTPEMAYAAYVQAVKKHYGPFARV